MRQTKVLPLFVLAVSAVFLAPTLVSAQEGSGEKLWGMAGCGLGSSWMGADGNQVLASTTNSSSYNQPFGISSGTSNCTDDGVVLYEKEKEVFVTANFESLELEMVTGNGDKLAALASYFGCPTGMVQKFGEMTRKNYDRLYGESTTPTSLIDALEKGIKNDATLAGACKA
jgi:hypothetical protein